MNELTLITVDGEDVAVYLNKIQICAADPQFKDDSYALVHDVATQLSESLNTPLLERQIKSPSSDWNWDEIACLAFSDVNPTERFAAHCIDPETNDSDVQYVRTESCDPFYSVALAAKHMNDNPTFVHFDRSVNDDDCLPLIHLQGNDYMVAPLIDNAAWVRVGNKSIQMKLNCEGLSIDVFNVGKETDGPIIESWALWND